MTKANIACTRCNITTLVYVYEQIVPLISRCPICGSKQIHVYTKTEEGGRK